MKNPLQKDSPLPGTPFSAIPVCLYSLVSRTQTGILPHAIDKKNIIINDVDDRITVRANENILAFIIGGLLSNAVLSSSDNCIRVETALAENGIQLKVRNNGPFTYSSHMYSLIVLTEAARQLGGDIYLKKGSGGGYAITLSLTAAA